MKLQQLLRIYLHYQNVFIKIIREELPTDGMQAEVFLLTVVVFQLSNNLDRRQILVKSTA